jgi:prophage antirepressor-like protein
MNTILTTAFEGKQNIRVLGTPEQPWFVAKDVCDILGIQNVADTIAKTLDSDEAGVETIYIRSGESGKNRQVSIVSESGLYALIFQSRKPEAKRFRKWVTSEVLPQLRRQGFYLMTGGEPPAMAEVHALTYRLEAAKLRAEAEYMERRAIASVEIPEGVSINEYLIQHRPELSHKCRANLTRSIKRAIVKQLKRPVGIARKHGNKFVAAQPSDIEAALKLVEQPA